MGGEERKRDKLPRWPVLVWSKARGLKNFGTHQPRRRPVLVGGKGETRVNQI